MKHWLITLSLAALALAANAGLLSISAGKTGVAVPAQVATFPLAIAADGRSFETAGGAPFYMNAEAAWSAFVQLTDAEWATYLDDRQGRGFNCILVEAVEHYFADDAPDMIAGGGGYAPFSTPDDIRTPVTAYFDRVVELVQDMDDRDMCALITPLYYGYSAGSEGWYSSAVATRTTGEVQTFCAYLANKLAAADNVVWVMYGDGYQSGAATRYNACATGIASEHSGIVTGHLAPESYSAQASQDGWLDFNYAYSYGLNAMRSMMADSYASSPARPSIMGETWYENDTNGNQTRLQLRQQAWYAYTMGQAGQIFGNFPVWHFNAPTSYGSGTWQSNLGSNGAADRAIFHAFTVAVGLGYCPPDGGTVLTGGVSTGESTATACQTADNSIAVVYTPTQRALTIAWSTMSGTTTAQWFNPTTGAYSTVSGSPFANSGSSDVTPPSSGDWALLLEAA